MNTYEYVASALGYLKIFNLPVLEDQLLLEEVKDIFSSLTTDKHRFSFLYNAYAENRYGKFMHEFYKDCVYSIHADSGGLQVITRGSDITEDVKNQVYESQRKYSDIAMSFDEIPLLVDEKSRIGSTQDRLFDDNIEDYVIKSADNLKKQIEFFDRHNSSTKPMMIIHGNCYDTFMKWFDIMIHNIPSDYHNKIAGIALSGASHGSGLKEEIERAVIIGQLSGFKNYFHLLGIGSISRLLPYIIFMNNGYYKNIHLSYDSTTHTKGVVNGTFMNSNFDRKRLTTNYNPLYIEAHNDLEKILNTNCSPFEFYKILNTDSSYFIGKEKEKKRNYFINRIGFFKLSVFRLQQLIENLGNESNVEAYAYRTGIYNEISNLYDVIDLDSYHKWLSHNSQITSKKIGTSSSNLEGFFN